MTEWSFFSNFLLLSSVISPLLWRVGGNFFRMRINHSQHASHTQSWPNAYGYLWRLAQKTSERGRKWRSFRHNSSPNESIMTGPTSKFLELKIMVTCKVWTKSNGWNARSPYLAPPPRTDTICYALYFKLGERVPSRPRRLLVGYHPDHSAEASVPITRGGLTVGTYFPEYNLFKLKIFWSMSIDVYNFAIESSTVLRSPQRRRLHDSKCFHCGLSPLFIRLATR